MRFLYNSLSELVIAVKYMFYNILLETNSEIKIQTGNRFRRSTIRNF